MRYISGDRHRLVLVGLALWPALKQVEITSIGGKFDIYRCPELILERFQNHLHAC